MKVKFLEAATVYPDGARPQRFEAGAVADFAGDYAALMVKKGHAAAQEDAPVAPAPTADPAPAAEAAS